MTPRLRRWPGCRWLPSTVPPLLTGMDVIVRLQDQGHWASITCMIRHRAGAWSADHSATAPPFARSIDGHLAHDLQTSHAAPATTRGVSL